MTDVLVIGAGPAGVLAALRAADLGAQTALVTSGAFGGMAWRYRSAGCLDLQRAWVASPARENHQ
jgi:pyruvate/2-oxoglutarate dehydrogenase complex dihydrolipoamide dehydrogenase (E3) component